MDIVNFDYEKYLKDKIEEMLQGWLKKILNEEDFQKIEQNQLYYHLFKLNQEMIKQRSSNSILSQDFITNITLLYDFTEI